MNPLDYLHRYIRVAEVIVIVAVIAFIALWWHNHDMEQQKIGEARIKALWDAQKVADKLAADKQEKDWREKYDSAISQGARNAHALQKAAAVAAGANDRLRDTNTELSKLLSSASPEAVRAYASAYQAVFADCVGEYRKMGQAAQGHANDAETLSNAWPNGQKTP